MLMLACVYAQAQNVALGRVIDAETKEPLAGATVAMKGDPIVPTDLQGAFEIPVDNPAQFVLYISRVGYESKQLEVIDYDGKPLEIQLVPAVIDLESVIVSATRAAKTDPFTSTNINVEQIDAIYAGQDPSVVLEKLSPSILSFSDAGADIGNYVQFRMRGIDQTRINTSLNGVPLNDMIDQGVFFSNFSDFGNSVESIQVQRGVGTSGNGVASYAGSVNFESKRLSEASPGGEVQLLTGSFGTFRASGEVSTGKLDNNLAFYSRFTRTVSDGFKDSSGSDSYSFFFSGGYLGSKDILRVTAFMGKTENDQSYLPVLLADINANPRTNYNHPNDTDNFEQELVQVQYGREISAFWNLNTTLYYGGSRGVFPFGLSDTNQLMFGLENDHYGFLSDVSYSEGSLDLKAGIHAYTFRRDNINYTAPNVTNPDYQDQTQKDEFSFFTKLNYDLGDFNLYGDFQLRSVKLGFDAAQVVSFGGPVPNGVDASRDWFFFNPKVGLSYELNSQSSLYASFGRTGREPTRTDILQGDGSAINEFSVVSVLDESIVQEEYVNDFEIGYELNTERLNIAANLFFMDFENEISLVGALAARSYVALRQNIANSSRSGAELQLQYKASSELSFDLNAAYLNTNVDEFDNGTEVFREVEHIFAPNWIISPAATWSPSEKFSLNLNGRYVSESFMELSNDADFGLPSYFILNSRADVQLAPKVTFSLMINNIFDELYFTDGAPVDLDFDGVVEGPGFRIQPPRNFYAMLKIGF